tara:strand:- start:410 stop:682 length:273 start_codon:yes stop_codon:yes gene_type:complete
MSDQTFGRAARAAWDEMNREPVKRFTVWHSTGKRDGDAAFDTRENAEIYFDDLVARADVLEVELIDNADPANPVTIKREAYDSLKSTTTV